MIKRTLSLLLAMLMILSMMPQSFAAENVLKLTAENVSQELKIGESVSVKINADQNPGYAFGGVVVTWDKDALELTGVNYDAKKAPNNASAAIQNTGEYTISFGDYVAAEDFKGTGTFFTLNFKILEGAKAGSYEIGVKADPAGISNKELQALSLEAKAGSVTFVSPESPTPDPKPDPDPEPEPTDGNVLKLTAASVTQALKTGETVAVNIDAEENPGYAFGGVVVTWDKDALELTGVNYDAKKAPNNASAAIQNTGEYTISFGDYVASEDFKGTGTFFTLNFKILEGAKAGSYEIGVKADPAGISNKELQALSLETKAGSVTFISPESPTPDPKPDPDPEPEPTDGTVLKLTAASVTQTLKAGETVAVNIDAEENPGYAFGGVVVTWDKDALELTGVNYDAKKAPNNASAAIQNTGEYTISFGDYVAAEDFKGSGTFFTLNFKILEGAKAGSYEIGVKADPAGISNKELKPLSLEATAGSITLTDLIPVNYTVTLDQKTTELETGKKTSLTATVSPEATAEQNIIWTSSDESVATVAQDGGVTGIKPGKATITVQIGDAKDECEVNVVNPQSSEPVIISLGERESTYSAEKGGSIFIPVMVSGNTGIGTVTGELEFDKNIFEISYPTEEDVATGDYAGSMDVTLFEGRFSGLEKSGRTIAEDGTLFWLKVKVADDAAAGSYPIRIKSDCLVTDGDNEQIKNILLEETNITVAESDAGLLGDVDNNGVVNAVDARLILQSNVKMITLTDDQIKRADVDQNGVVDALDARYILQLNVKMIQSFDEVKAG